MGGVGAGGVDDEDDKGAPGTTEFEKAVAGISGIATKKEWDKHSKAEVDNSFEHGWQPKWK